jgi:hypothetical protein
MCYRMACLNLKAFKEAVLVIIQNLGVALWQQKDRRVTFAVTNHRSHVSNLPHDCQYAPICRHCLARESDLLLLLVVLLLISSTEGTLFRQRFHGFRTRPRAATSAFSLFCVRFFLTSTTDRSGHLHSSTSIPSPSVKTGIENSDPQHISDPRDRTSHDTILIDPHSVVVVRLFFRISVTHIPPVPTTSAVRFSW